MAEAFKNWINVDVISGVAAHFIKHNPRFDQQGFVALASDNLDALELKARMAQVTQAMIEYLPEDFERAGKIILNSLGPPLGDDLSAGKTDDLGIGGWVVICMADYVALQGHDHFALSMELLKALTQRATSEFSVRAFLLSSKKEQTLAMLSDWASDTNPHVRRLVSEGTRPRLPWATQLPDFIKDPAPVLSLLEQLKDDDSEYVRRSVANNLNDIAKDHPDRVAEIAQKWMKGASVNRQRLVKHACRTLVKNGHKKTLRVLGYGPPKLEPVDIENNTSKLQLGQALEFTVSLRSKSTRSQSLVIDYAIHHQKANGTLSPKVFKWKTISLSPAKEVVISKKHAIKKITTRKYYAGEHKLELIINGVSMCIVDFELEVDS